MMQRKPSKALVREEWRAREGEERGRKRKSSSNEVIKRKERFSLTEGSVAQVLAGKKPRLRSTSKRDW